MDIHGGGSACKFQNVTQLSAVCIREISNYFNFVAVETKPLKQKDGLEIEKNMIVIHFSPIFLLTPL